jgi:hypothetical protein
MHVVLDAAHNDGLAVEVAEDAAQVAVQLLAQGSVAQGWSALFGGKDGVNDDLGQRLRHAVRMSGRSRGCIIERVGGLCGRLSQGRTARPSSPAVQPWAELCNPFRIGGKGLRECHILCAHGSVVSGVEGLTYLILKAFAHSQHRHAVPFHARYFFALGLLVE